MASRKRHERCDWMARKMTEWPSKRRPLTKIMPSDGCKGDTVPLALNRRYSFREFGCHLGNVGLILSSAANGLVWDIVVKHHDHASGGNPHLAPAEKSGTPAYGD